MEIEKRNVFRHLFQGNAEEGKHWADADHVFQAYKYEKPYFITEDKRILSKASDVLSLTKTLKILSLNEFINKIGNKHQQ